MGGLSCFHGPPTHPFIPDVQSQPWPVCTLYLVVVLAVVTLTCRKTRLFRQSTALQPYPQYPQPRPGIPGAQALNPDLLPSLQVSSFVVPPFALLCFALPCQVQIQTQTQTQIHLRQDLLHLRLPRFSLISFPLSWSLPSTSPASPVTPPSENSFSFFTTPLSHAEPPLILPSLYLDPTLISLCGLPRKRPSQSPPLSPGLCFPSTRRYHRRQHRQQASFPPPSST